MPEPRALVRLVHPKPQWQPFDPHAPEKNADPFNSDTHVNIHEGEVFEGPPLKPGELFFVEEFTLSQHEEGEAHAEKVNIFLDRPKNSVIILSLGLISDELVNAKLADGSMGDFLQERLHDAIEALSNRPDHQSI